MSRLVKAAVTCSALGYAFAIYSLISPTALAMSLFGFLGVPLFGLGAALYLIEVIRDLKNKQVL